MAEGNLETSIVSRSSKKGQCPVSDGPWVHIAEEELARNKDKAAAATTGALVYFEHCWR